MTRWDVLIELIQTNGYRHIAEIGVHRGKTARKVLAACELELYILVDPIYSPQVARLEGNFQSVIYDIETSQHTHRGIGTGILDLVFLDALHTYRDVKNDIGWWLPKIRPGGILCGDDYGQRHCGGVKRAVDEMFGDRVELRQAGRSENHIWIVRIDQYGNA